MKLPAAFCKDSDHIHVIIETPKGSLGKYAFDPETELFELKKVLPAGIAFPLNFGFIPQTKADDGDPVDVLVLTEQSLAVGCLVECRVIGVVQANQQDKGQDVQRNDRLIAIPVVSHEYETIQTIEDMSQPQLNDITHFFEYYRAMSGSTFTPLGNQGPEQALAWIREHIV